MPKLCAALCALRIWGKNLATHPRWKTRPRLMKSSAQLGRARHSCARRSPELQTKRRAEDCAPYPINGLSERRFRWLRLVATQNFDPATKPISFVGETVGTRDAFDCPISFDYIEPDAPLQLAQTNRTEMQRAPITFAQVIRAVHQTIEKRTVR